MEQATENEGGSAYHINFKELYTFFDVVQVSIILTHIMQSPQVLFVVFATVSMRVNAEHLPTLKSNSVSDTVFRLF